MFENGFEPFDEAKAAVTDLIDEYRAAEKSDYVVRFLSCSSSFDAAELAVQIEEWRRRKMLERRGQGDVLMFPLRSLSSPPLFLRKTGLRCSSRSLAVPPSPPPSPPWLLPFVFHPHNFVFVLFFNSSPSCVLYYSFPSLAGISLCVPPSSLPLLRSSPRAEWRAETWSTWGKLKGGKGRQCPTLAPPLPCSSVPVRRRRTGRGDDAALVVVPQYGSRVKEKKVAIRTLFFLPLARERFAASPLAKDWPGNEFDDPHLLLPSSTRTQHYCSTSLHPSRLALLSRSSLSPFRGNFSLA